MSGEKTESHLDERGPSSNVVPDFIDRFSSSTVLALSFGVIELRHIDGSVRFQVRYSTYGLPPFWDRESEDLVA